jgi:hypothetical protein
VLLICWGYMPTEVREAFRPMLVQYLWLLPPWCRKLYVSYKQAHDSGDTDADASCGAMVEYRTASISIHAGWLDRNPASRRDAVVHEVLHVPTMPMVQEQEDVIKRLVGDEAEKFRGHLQEQWRQRFEGTVQDLTFSILMLPADTLPPVPFREEEDEHPQPLDLRARPSA